MFIGKADLSSDADVSKIVLLGLSIMTFSASLWFGAISGSSARLGKSISSIIFPDAADAEAIKHSHTATEAVALSLLRARLQALGADNSTISVVLQIASKEIREKSQGLPSNQVDDLVGEIKAASELFSRESASGDDYSILKQALLWEATLFESVANSGYDARPPQRLYLGELRKSVWSWLNSPDVHDMPEESRKSLIAIHNKAVALEAWLSTPSWIGETPLTKDMDEFLFRIVGSKRGRGDSNPVFVFDPENPEIPEL